MNSRTDAGAAHAQSQIHCRSNPGAKAPGYSPPALRALRALAPSGRIGSGAALCAAVALLGLAVGGCKSVEQRSIEALSLEIASNISDAAAKAIENGTNQFTARADVRAINPAYVIRADAKWVVGLETEISVGAEGVAIGLEAEAGAEAPGK